MISVFFGNDHVGVRKKAFDAVLILRENGADVADLTRETYSRSALIDLAQSTSLFGTARVVVLDSLKDQPEFFEEVQSELDMLSASETHFVVIEGPLLAGEKKAFEKSGAKMAECTKKENERFNTFSLADALVRRDRKSLWILYLRALQSGISVEEIIGTLLWQVKSIRLAMRTTSAAEAGVKPFVYTKSKSAAKLYTMEAMDQLSGQLVRIYHDGHRGAVESDLALERLILTL